MPFCGQTQDSRGTKRSPAGDTRQAGRQHPGGPHLEVGELQVLVGLSALELLKQVAAGLGLAEGGQPLLAAPQALRPPQHAGQQPQLGQLPPGAGGRPGGAAVAVAEGLAVAEQAVEPHAHLQVVDALGPVLGAVLVQAVAIGGLERHQLVPREAAEAVPLVLSPRRRQQRRQHQPHCCGRGRRPGTTSPARGDRGGTGRDGMGREKAARPRGGSAGPGAVGGESFPFPSMHNVEIAGANGCRAISRLLFVPLWRFHPAEHHSHSHSPSMKEEGEKTR